SAAFRWSAGRNAERGRRNAEQRQPMLVCLFRAPRSAFRVWAPRPRREATASTERLPGLSQFVHQPIRRISRDPRLLRDLVGDVAPGHPLGEQGAGTGFEIGRGLLADGLAGSRHYNRDFAAGRRCGVIDRKSTRLNSSYSQISYAAFCLKKKKQRNKIA